MINRDNLINDYFNWIENLVCGAQKYRNRTSFRRLLMKLHSTIFTYSIEMDANRAGDGRDLRYRYGAENGYTHDEIAKYLDTRDCSILEMMVALADRMEVNFMDDPSYGDRTAEWFWSMVVSLGLGGMSDDKYDEIYVNSRIDIFLSRRYESNGRGGLFTLAQPYKDVRDVEIWWQAMWYINECIDLTV